MELSTSFPSPLSLHSSMCLLSLCYFIPPCTMPVVFTQSYRSGRFNMERNQMTGLDKQWGRNIRWSVYWKPHMTPKRRNKLTGMFSQKPETCTREAIRFNIQLPWKDVGRDCSVLDRLLYAPWKEFLVCAFIKNYMQCKGKTLYVRYTHQYVPQFLKEPSCDIDFLCNSFYQSGFHASTYILLY
jgi:hypothetical protein